MAIKRINAPVPEGGRSYSSRYAEDIRTFLASGSPSAEMEVPAGSIPKSVSIGYLVALRKPEFAGKARVTRRGNRVFLVRAEPAKEG